MYLATWLVGSAIDAHKTDCNLVFFLSFPHIRKAEWLSGIANRLWAGEFGVRRQEINLCPNLPGWSCDPRSLSFNRYSRSFPCVKRPGRDVDHSLLSSAEVKN